MCNVKIIPKLPLSESQWSVLPYTSGSRFLISQSWCCSYEGSKAKFKFIWRRKWLNCYDNTQHCTLKISNIFTM
jgi:hypothetical protein